ncbi:acyl-CoA dehydrogenase family protein [Nocardioides endophyticus]
MTVRQVPWARHASHLLVVDAAGLTLVDLAHESVDVEEVRNEAGEPRDNVTFGRDAARSLEAVPSPAAVTNRLALLWSAAVAGAIEGTYRLTRDYVNSRHQFGAPLIKIPAVAALLATVKVELVQVDASLARARREMTDEGDLRRATAAVGSARVVSARAATVAARLSHQLHGAMGITAEYPLHRHTTRLWAWRDEAGSELEWATGLGDMALSLGEEGLWDALTN